ncbi:MAG: hypothetical protein U5L96_09505 [Owenweeksia sp.]|nr:hypothetical protein [Owenweeksia sp.]
MQNLTALNGCDSTHTINLTVKPQRDTTLNATICQGQSLHGYTTSGKLLRYTECRQRLRQHPQPKPHRAAQREYFRKRQHLPGREL